MPRRLLAAVSAIVLLLATAAGCRVSGSVDCPGLPTTAPTATTSGTCSWTYMPDVPATTTSGSPTTTITTTTAPTTTTTTPPPTTTTTTTNVPPPGVFPSPSTTGVPASRVLQPVHNGNLTIAKPGTYSGLHVTGALIITAPGVTVTDSWVEGAGVDSDEVITNGTPAGSARLAVSDTTIGNPAVCNGQPGIGEHDYTADHIRIIGMGDGFRVSGNNVTVTNSYVQTCNHATNHDDALQVYCDTETLPQPCHNVTIDHNTLSVANTTNFTAPLFGGDTGGTNGQLANSAFTNNLLWGGVYSIFLYGTGLTITGNRVVTNPWHDTTDGNTYNGWVYGASDVTCPTVTWSDNRAVPMDGNWQPTGAGTALACA